MGLFLCDGKVCFVGGIAEFGTQPARRMNGPSPAGSITQVNRRLRQSQ
jgi:hypothetical protein